MIEAGEVEEALHRLFIAVAGTHLRREERKKAREMAAFLELLRPLVRDDGGKRPRLIVDAAAGKAYVGVLAAALLGARRVVVIERDAARAEAARAAFARLQAGAGGAAATAAAATAAAATAAAATAAAATAAAAGIEVGNDAAAPAGSAPAAHAAAPVPSDAAPSYVVQAGDVADRALWPAAPQVVAALHACGAASDAILDAAVAVDARWILLVPCCYAASVPFAAAAEAAAERLGLPRAAEVRRRFVTALIDAERTLRLEAAGYETTVLPLVPPTVTPHNLIWRARRVREPRRMAEAAAQLARLGAG